MKLYSTSNRSHTTNFAHAVLQGQADDGGLYMLEHINSLSASFFHNIATMSFPDMASEVMRMLLGDAVNAHDLDAIVREAMNFDAPLVQLDEQTFVVELFHGPTLAFKDFGARFMARMMQYLREKHVSDTPTAQELTVLVATSGDTGSAVARGFWKTPGMRVVILYPHGKVSHVQEQQLTTMGENVQALEIQGTFDDCQALVKTAFRDAELNKSVALTSANSINIARLLPQSLYYFRAYAQLQNLLPRPLQNSQLLFCTPSGNFGNLTAGMFAKKMGLSVSRFIAGVNRNDTMPLFLQTGTYQAKPSVSTPSNAMDVGNPSNFVRMFDLYEHDVERLRQDVWSVSISDEETLATVKHVYEAYHYVVCPHTAVGYAAFKRYQESLLKTPVGEQATMRGVILATAHPAKFGDIVEPVLQTKIEIPPRLQEYLDKPKNALVLPNEYERLKTYLIETAR
jgi:threonine synthase